MSYYQDEINAQAGRELCAKAAMGNDGKIVVHANRKCASFADWSQLLSASRIVLGVGSGAVVRSWSKLTEVVL